MTNNIISVNNLTGGSISDKVYSRTDAENYSSYAKELKNFLVQPQGGIASRDGTKYIGEVKDSSSNTRLIPFIFSQNDAYILEMGDQYIRFYRDDAQVLDSDKTIINITQANPAVVTSTSHGFTNGDHVYISEVVGMTELNGRRFTVANQTTNTFELSGIDSTSYTAYDSAGVANEVYTLTSPFTADQIWDVDYTQTGNTMLFTHGSHYPQELVRISDTNWTISDYTLVDGPYLDQNTTATTLTPSATTGAITMTASASLFVSTDVGRVIRYYDGGSWGYVTITGYTSATVVNATVNSTLGGTTAVTTWRLGSFSETTGFPEVVTIYEQRVYFGATDTEQDTIWASALGDFNNFTPGTTDSDSFTITANSTKYNRLRFLEPSNEGIYVGTVGDLFLLRSSDTTSGITPSSVALRWLSADGASNVKPVKSGKSVLFSSRTTNRLIELRNLGDAQGYSLSNVANLSEHIANNGVVELAYQEEPNSIIWIAQGNGDLAALTHNRSQNILAWSKCILGTNSTKAYVDSVASIPTSNENQLWAIIERVIDGNTVKYIEVLRPHFFRDYDNRVQDAKLLDCSLAYSGEAPAYTLTPAATTGSAVEFTASGSVFTANDVGRTIRAIYANSDGTTTYSKGIIVTYTSATVVEVDIEDDFANTDAIASGLWTLSSIDFTGAHHLAGETVSVFTDGGTHADVTISDTGTFSLGDQYTNVLVGYGYTQKYRSVDLNTQLPNGAGIGSKNRIKEIIIKRARSVGGMVGRDDVGFDTIQAVPGFSTPTPLTTDKQIVKFKHNYQDECEVTIKQESPLPLNITGYTVKCEVNSTD